MLFIKLYYHILCFIKKIFYKLIYGKRIKFGKNVQFRKGFSLVIEKNAKVEIGDGCFFNNYCSINALEHIKIGDNCLFGENVKIYDHNHIYKYKNKLIKESGFKTGKIDIDENCWICSNVVILKNVQIGENSVIGTGEIVKEMKIDSNKIVFNSNISNIRLEEK